MVLALPLDGVLGELAGAVDDLADADTQPERAPDTFQYTSTLIRIRLRVVRARSQFGLSDRHRPEHLRAGAEHGSPADRRTAVDPDSITDAHAVARGASIVAPPGPNSSSFPISTTEPLAARMNVDGRNRLPVPTLMSPPRLSMTTFG